MPRHGAICSEGYELNLGQHYVIPRCKAFVGVEPSQNHNGLKQEQIVRLAVPIALSGTGTASSFLRLVHKLRNR